MEREIKPIPAMLVIAIILIISGCQLEDFPLIPKTPTIIPPSATIPNPTSWTEESVSFPFDSNLLQGILTLPIGEGPFPGLVLISGAVDPNTGVRSSASDNWQVDHARKIAEAGFAVLRYDPPGVGNSSGEAGYESLDVRREESLAARDYLQSRSEINPDRIGLWGGSQGSWVIAMAAAKSPSDVAFLISVAGSGTTVADQQVHSIQSESKAANMPEIDITKAVLFGRLLIDWQVESPLYKKENITDAESLGEGPWQDFLALVYEPGDISPSESLQQTIMILESIQDEPWTKFLYLKELYVPQLKSIPPEQIAGMKALSGPSLLIDPKDFLTQITCPVLAIFGENDPLQPTRVSATLFEQYLTEAGNDHFKIVVIPDEGHSTFVTKTFYFDLLIDWLVDLY